MSLSCFSQAMSIYWTHLGLINLTWSYTTLGLILTGHISLAGAAACARFVLLTWLIATVRVQVLLRTVRQRRNVLLERTLGRP